MLKEKTMNNLKDYAEGWANEDDYEYPHLKQLIKDIYEEAVSNGCTCVISKRGKVLIVCPIHKQWGDSLTRGV